MAGNEWMDAAANQGAYVRYTSDGIGIVMLVASPGNFYTEKGDMTSTEMAKKAGYDVEPLLKMKEKGLKIAEAMKAIEAQFGGVSRETIVKRGDYQVIHLGGGRYNVEHVDGTVMNQKGHLSHDIAVKTLRAITPEVEEEKAEAKAA